MFCKNCGEAMNDNQAICLKCGVKTGEGNAYCANCGEAVDANASVCLKCGVAIKKAAIWPARTRLPLRWYVSSWAVWAFTIL